MVTLGLRKPDAIALPAALLLVGAVAVVSIFLPGSLPWALVALTGLAVIVYGALRWELAILPFLWVLSFGLLEAPPWKVGPAYFFNMTPPRFLFLAAALAFVLYFLTRKGTLRFDRGIFWAMLALLTYFAISASVFGWVSAAVVSYK